MTSNEPDACDAFINFKKTVNFFGFELKLEEADNVEELYECRIYSEVIWQYYEGSNYHFEELFNQQNQNLFRKFWSDLDCYQFETMDNYELGGCWKRHFRMFSVLQFSLQM